MWLGRRRAMHTFRQRMVCTRCGIVGADARPKLAGDAGEPGLGVAQFSDEFLYDTLGLVQLNSLVRSLPRAKA